MAPACPRLCNGNGRVAAEAPVRHLILILVSLPAHAGCGERTGGEDDLWASVVACGEPPPVPERPEHDLDAVATLVAALVVLDGLAA